MNKKLKTFFCVFSSVLVLGVSVLSVPAVYKSKADYVEGGDIVTSEGYTYFNPFSIFELWFLYTSGVVNSADYYSSFHLTLPDTFMLDGEPYFSSGVNCKEYYSEAFLEGNSFIDSVYGHSSVFDGDYSAIYDISFNRTDASDAHDEMDFFNIQLMTNKRYVFTPELWDYLFGYGEDGVFISFNGSGSKYKIGSIEFNANFWYETDDMSMLRDYQHTKRLVLSPELLDTFDGDIPDYSLSYWFPSSSELRDKGAVIAGADGAEYIYLRGLQIRINPLVSEMVAPGLENFNFYIWSESMPLIAYEYWNELQSDGLLLSGSANHQYSVQSKDLFWRSVQGFFDIELFEGFYIYHVIIIVLGCFMLAIVVKILLGG